MFLCTADSSSLQPNKGTDWQAFHGTFQDKPVSVHLNTNGEFIMCLWSEDFSSRGLLCLTCTHWSLWIAVDKHMVPVVRQGELGRGVKGQGSVRVV